MAEVETQMHSGKRLRACDHNSMCAHKLVEDLEKVKGATWKQCLGGRETKGRGADNQRERERVAFGRWTNEGEEGGHGQQGFEDNLARLQTAAFSVDPATSATGRKKSCTNSSQSGA